MNASMNNINGLNSDSDVTIPNAETSEMSKYHLTWIDTEGKPQTATFYLPEDVDPKAWVGSLLNLVELDAEEHAYTLKVIP